MSVLNSFFKDLTNEESKFIPILEGDNLGLLMRCAINELDWFYYNYSREAEPSFEQSERLYVLSLGVARLVKIVLENRESFDVPVVTMPRRKDFTVKVLSLASALGIIQHGRRVAQTIAGGIGEIKKTGDMEYEVYIPEYIEDDGVYERAVVEHYNKESRQKLKDFSLHEKWREIEKEVEKKLDDLVYPFMEHYIGYGADPVLDEYFFGIASHEVSLKEGYDSYHYAVEFGGVRIQHYMLGLKFVVAHSMRHERFAEALVKKCSDIKLENVLTISADIDSFVESIRDAVNYFGSAYEGFEEIGIGEANIIFKVLTYGRESLDLIDPPGSPYPLSIKCSENGVIRALFGAYSEPVRYLLESLRFHFPKDFDRNQSGREKSLQRAVRRVIDDTINEVEYLENIKMRLDKRVLSDIDLVALEKKTGTIVFFQLKHQELYGADIHAKKMRNERLKKQASDWVDSVEKWVSGSGLNGVLKALQLPKDWGKNVDILKVVLSRHYAYSLRDVVVGGDSAFSNWPQFFNVAQIVKESSKPTLKDFIFALKENQEETNKEIHLQEPATRWSVHKLAFLVTQEKSR
ncbi:hypothetical protein [Alcanivorax jadensis]|uniref:hypothetical protein n=1 Tax=Alcanivorax jadensis TaxID=64988 RepID=UPI0023558B71|nr:hypothetical protein [Alcanivorax jadensis]|tara:strand:- start:32438 stop:34165 length:1728 start_codon:yes stop_codon:yes gene_type:complete